MNFSFFNPAAYLTAQPAPVDGLTGKIIFGVFLLFCLLGVVGRIMLEQRTFDRYVIRIMNRWSTCLLTMGFLGLMIFFLSYENIPLLGARFWYVLWVIGFLVWTFFLVRFMTREVPALREKNLREHAKSKYLPGRKRA